ncbi:LOW QUALITY PROTEIN: hypothetical protein MAR_001918 [Mya arenaria]|uniref:Uncharacterized protein n=1 Tax=Mya arenaria TaxID=6604 RepID=A0ABY7FD53_MYAAR|nr:LOW QUALITY PROTEIN: hypothetical protein MAR_001918 [Mya arenaria]
MSQIIDSPTNFTESTESVIDLIFTSEKTIIHTNGVAEPFLDQNVRYHCPIYGVFLNFQRPKHAPFYRHIWLFEKVDFNKRRRVAAYYNWESLRDADVETYTANIISEKIAISKICIPNRRVLIKDHDPPPPPSDQTIRLQIRRRKRAYLKARRLTSEHLWNKFIIIKNETTNLIKFAKHKYSLSLADKLKTQHNSS